MDTFEREMLELSIAQGNIIAPFYSKQIKNQKFRVTEVVY
jgi:hypothetical protein